MEHRNADFWQTPVITALVITLIVIFLAAATQQCIMNELFRDNRNFRQGFYLTLAGKPTDQIKEDEQAAEGILLANEFKEVLTIDVSQGEEAKLDAFFEFVKLEGGIYECNVFSDRELLKKMLFGSEPEKDKALEGIIAPVFWAKPWKIAGIVYWLCFSLVVSISYFLQCSYYEIHYRGGKQDFWRLPYNKAGTYLMILLLLPGLILCVFSWLIVKFLTGDLTKIVPKRKSKKVSLQIPDIGKSRDDLDRLRQKL